VSTIFLVLDFKVILCFTRQKTRLFLKKIDTRQFTMQDYSWTISKIFRRKRRHHAWIDVHGKGEKGKESDALMLKERKVREETVFVA
jgi:hypothetical protein